MIKERIQEIFEFTQSQSPYSKANKGWINQDIFLDLSPSSDNLEEKREAAKITLFWSPIYSLLSNLFIILIISSILVFASLSIVKGRFEFNLINTYMINSIVEVDDNKFSNKSEFNDLDLVNSRIDENNEKDQIEKSNKINSSDDVIVNSTNNNITKEIDKQEILKKDFESNNDIKILKNKNPKSNFI